MSRRTKIRKKPQVTISNTSLQNAQGRVSRSARQAARRMGPTTRQARRMAASGMTSARIWSAPRIDQAGRYIETQVGPSVGAMLHRTAGRVRPKAPRNRRGFATVLLMMGAVLGAAGAVATRRSTERPTGEPAGPAPADRLSTVSGDSSGTESAHSS